ncbi:type II toxin-antitoxin system HicA family toxin [Nocardioides sp. LHD-245]|uniref:type II toxin-antitoxin system HicA family toxin n=1 Tax=Nocardioides sp. LHD-245 TaxID=3051387 RepID=UPI0027E09EAF|nr:type II toxin-antitoxin system HicA family toxin [Nocardioides sp. LHD-245]
MGRAPGFGTLKARRLRRLLEHELGYAVAGNPGGSHRRLTSPGRPPLVFAYHDNEEIGGWMVRKILVSAGLSVEEAKEVFRRA